MRDCLIAILINKAQTALQPPMTDIEESDTYEQ
jgi:hypothetical protein